jgi:hypothetical protein
LRPHSRSANSNFCVRNAIFDNKPTSPPRRSQLYSLHPARRQSLVPDRGGRVCLVVEGAVKRGRRGLLGCRVIETIDLRGHLFGSIYGSGLGRSFIVQPIEPLTLRAFTGRFFEETPNRRSLDRLFPGKPRTEWSGSSLTFQFHLHIQQYNPSTDKSSGCVR